MSAMMKTADIRLIAAMGNQRQIGLYGDLPWPDKDGDLKLFRESTAGGVVVMGMKTFDPLRRTISPKDREFIGIDRAGMTRVTRKWTTSTEMAGMLDRPEETMDLLAFLSIGRTIWIAGGARIYAAFAPFCSPEKSIVTRINYDGPADTFMPPLPWENPT